MRRFVTHRSFFRLACLGVLALLWTVCPSRAHAVEAAVGFSAVDEGDDRMRPGAALHLGITPDYYGKIFYWGRDFGPVKERTYLISGGRRWSLFGNEALEAGLGFVFMDESYAIQYEDPADQKFDREEHNYNAGAGFHLSLQLPAQPIYMTLSWDSHVFLAGSGGLLLATGRKNAVSFLLGMDL